MTYNFKNYTNITFIDEKLNLCDFLIDLIKVHCPVPPGIYQIKNYTDTIPNQFWPVSNRYSVSLLLFYFIGSVLCQSYCIQWGRRGNDVSNDRTYYQLNCSNYYWWLEYNYFNTFNIHWITYLMPRVH